MRRHDINAIHDRWMTLRSVVVHLRKIAPNFTDCHITVESAR
jgi:hypothetical protein